MKNRERKRRLYVMNTDWSSLTRKVLVSEEGSMKVWKLNYQKLFCFSKCSVRVGLIC